MDRLNFIKSITRESTVSSEENIGALLFYFELTTALMAELMNVNGYDQPGVEMQKKYTKALRQSKR
mgnify:CR=1 FL=1